MGRLRALVKKELISIWQNPRSRFAILVPPILQLFVFTFAATFDVTNSSIGVLNLDQGLHGNQLLQSFYDNPIFTQITPLSSSLQIPKFLDEQEGTFVLSIPQTFSQDLEKNAGAKIGLFLDGRSTNNAQILLGYVQEIITSFSQKYPSHQPVIALSRYWFNPNLNYQWYNISCLTATLAMVTCLVVTSLSIAREKEMGTFSQLLVSPLHPREVVFGKVIPGVLVGLVEASLMLIAGIFFFKTPFTGNLALFYLSLFVFVSSISGIGLFISSVAKTQQQAILGTFLFISPSTVLSGFATPIENMPGWLQPVTYLMPLRYMLIISKGSYFKAMPSLDLWNQLWPMALIACVTLTGTSIFFRRRLE